MIHAATRPFDTRRARLAVVIASLSAAVASASPTIAGAAAPAEAAVAAQAVPVTAFNFVRAETDLYFAKTVKNGAFGRLTHRRRWRRSTTRTWCG